MSPQSTTVITSENCSICLLPMIQEIDDDDSELGPPISIGCQADHQFHRWCVKKLIETNGLSTKCPLDRELTTPLKLIDFALTLNIPLEVVCHDRGVDGIRDDFQSMTEHEVLGNRNSSESFETVVDDRNDEPGIERDIQQLDIQQLGIQQLDIQQLDIQQQDTQQTAVQENSNVSWLEAYSDDREISALVHDASGVEVESLADEEDMYLLRNEPDQDDETHFLNDMRQIEELEVQTELILGETVRPEVESNESLIDYIGVTEEVWREQTITDNSFQSNYFETGFFPDISRRSSDFWFAGYPFQRNNSVRTHFYPEYQEIWRRIEEIADEQEINRYCLRILEQEIKVNLFLSTLDI